MDFNPVILAELLKLDLPLIGNQAGLTDDMSVYEARVYSMGNSLFKKWLPEDSSELEAVALNDFYVNNAACVTTFTLEHVSQRCESIIHRARALMSDFFYSDSYGSNCLTLGKCLNYGRPGPGSSIGTKHTDFYQKMFKSRLTYTSEALYRNYRANISTSWLQAELIRAEAYGQGVVEGSKLSTVPKNCKTNRTICTEPSLNMFYQLGAGAIIEQLLLRYHNIDLSKQPEINKALARVGSVNGEIATIDLKAASDTISLGLVRYLLPPLTVSCLELLRSPITKHSERGNEVLNMISSMGNGFTFPLQTMIFATLVRATYDELGIKPVNHGASRNYAVFGDDIICLSEAYDVVVEVLHSCGFSVNIQKSYATGPFRESCGGDYFKGHDIRGVYLKEGKNHADSYSIFNRLTRWSARYGIPIPRVLQYVKGLADFRPVPLHCGDTEGHKVPLEYANNPRANRNGSHRYFVLSKRDRTLRVKDDHELNPFGFIISHIGGYLRNGKATLRSNKSSYKVVKRLSPHWNEIVDAGLTIRDYQLTLGEILCL